MHKWYINLLMSMAVGTTVLTGNLNAITLGTKYDFISSFISTETPLGGVFVAETTNDPQIPEILQRIAECESGGRQFTDTGSVVRGRVNPLDIGKWQINAYYHQATAEKLGYDIYTEEGNTKYALYLYKEQGTTPWSWSKDCWLR